jgi:hypothetical protein
VNTLKTAYKSLVILNGMKNKIVVVVVLSLSLMVCVLVPRLLSNLSKEDTDSISQKMIKKSSNAISRYEQARRPNRMPVPKVNEDVSRTDVGKAITEINHIIDHDKKCEAIAQLANSWAKDDPDKCFEWALELNAYDEKSAALIQLTSVLACSGQLDKLVKFINLTPKGQYRDHMIVFGFSAMIANDPTRALELTNQLTGRGAIYSVSEDIAEYFVNNYSTSDITANIDQIGHGDLREFVNAYIVSQLAVTDPQSAMDYLSMCPNMMKDGTMRSLSSIATNYAKEGIQKSLASIDTLSDNFQKKQYSSMVGSALAKSYPEDSIEFIITNSNSNNYKKNIHIFKGIIDQLSPYDYDLLRNSLDTIDDKNVRNALIVQSAISVSNSNPERAAEELRSVYSANEKVDVSAISGVVTRWMSRDSLEASKWIKSLDPGPFRDSAVVPLINNILKIESDLPSAASWANTISDPEERNLQIDRIDKMR